MAVEGDKRVDAKTQEPEIYLNGTWTTDWESLGATVNAVTGVAQQVDVAFDSATLNQGYTSSNTDYTSPQHDLMLGVGSVKLDLKLFQATTSLEAGTRVGGKFEVLNPTGDDTVIASYDFFERSYDTDIGWYDSATLAFDVPATGVYRVQFTNNGGVGAGNRTPGSGNLRVTSIGVTANTSGIPGVAGPAGPQGDAGRGVATVHRSDGVTAIGGTVYTLDHAIYEYTDGVFEDKGLIAPSPGQSYKVEGIYQPASEVVINNTVINTGFDMTTPNSRVTFYFKDSSATRPWPAATIFCSMITDLSNSGVAFYVWNHDNAYMSGHINGAANKAAGAIRFTDTTRGVSFVRAEFEVLS